MHAFSVQETSKHNFMMAHFETHAVASSVCLKDLEELNTMGQLERTKMSTKNASWFVVNYYTTASPHPTLTVHSVT